MKVHMVLLNIAVLQKSTCQNGGLQALNQYYICDWLNSNQRLTQLITQVINFTGFLSYPTLNSNFFSLLDAFLVARPKSFRNPSFSPLYRPHSPDIENVPRQSTDWHQSHAISTPLSTSIHLGAQWHWHTCICLHR